MNELNRSKKDSTEYIYFPAISIHEYSSFLRCQNPSFLQQRQFMLTSLSDPWERQDSGIRTVVG